MPALVLALLAALAALPPSRAVAAGPGIETCAACHGADGVALTEDIPSLGGQNEAYLYEALKDFASGKRPSAIMRGIVRELGDADMRALARHFASQPYVRKRQAIAAETTARGQEVYQRLCQICHLEEGRNTTYAEYPLLAGQSLPYMRKQMGLILDKRRSVEVSKQGMLELLTRPQIDDALQFFAGQQVSPDQVAGGLTTTAKRTRRTRFRTDPKPDPDGG